VPDVLQPVSDIARVIHVAATLVLIPNEILVTPSSVLADE